MEAIGRRRWAIPEGYIPSESSYSDRDLASHETACILNAGDRDAHVAITICFADREPVGPYRVTIAGLHTLHLRFNDLDDPQPIPRYRLRLRLRIRRSDHRATHAARFPSRRARPSVDRCLSARLISIYP